MLVACAVANISLADLWVDYLGLTGYPPLETVSRYVNKGGPLPSREVRVLEQASLERLRDQTRPAPELGHLLSLSTTQVLDRGSDPARGG